MLCSWSLKAQADQTESKNDTSLIEVSDNQDSIKSIPAINDSVISPQTGDSGGNVGTQRYKVSNDTLDAPIDYTARDSFRINIKDKVIHLYGEAQVNYQEIELTAERIDYYWENGEVVAYGIYDSVLGKEIGQPLFKESGSTYLAEHFRYNFKSKKGKSKGMVMKEADGYLHGEQLKSIGEDVLYGKKIKYTTCNYEHPHFYIEIDKAKILKDKVIVGKPANFVLEGVRTPLWLPFGFYPIIKNRNSGFLQPNFSFNYNNDIGYGIRDLGFFWAINDNFGLTTKADVFTHGNYTLYALMDYRKRYKYSGNLDLVFLSRVIGERRDPDFVGAERSLSLRWSMQIDPKKLNNASFKINTNIETRGFNKNITGVGDSYLNNSLNSSISFSKNWPGKPVRLSLSANHSQNTSTGRINLTVPSLTFNLNTINPFAGLGKTSEAKWYDNIYFTYNLRTETRVSGIDSTFFSEETLEDLQFGVRQTASAGTKIKLFKYININPSFNYNEYWYPDELQRTFMDTLVEEDGDTLFNQVVSDQVFGFNSARDFNMRFNMSWTLYGTFEFKKRKRVKAMRHVVRPSLSFSYRPDFTKDRWGYYETVPTDTEGGSTTYSRFQGAIYGGPPSQEQLSLNFSITNDLELKFLSKRDTTGKAKKIRLLSGGRISGNYNFARDSLRLSDLSFSTGSTEIYKGIRVNFSGLITPYYVDPETNRRQDRWLFSETKRFFRLESFRMNVSGNFKSKKSTGNSSAYRGAPQYEPYYNDPYLGARYDYVDFSIPWNLRFDYNLTFSKDFKDGVDEKNLQHSSNLTFDFSLTPKWQIKTNLKYNFTEREFNSASISVNRDLHCWYLFVNWQAVGRQYITFGVRIKSSQLGFLNRAEKSIPNNSQLTDFNTGLPF